MSHPRQQSRDVLVHQAVWEAEGVLGLVLVDPHGKDLPEWEPGAHIDVTLPSGLIRQYSLCGDPRDRSRYRIGVLREPHGRGGSAEIHSTPLVGTTLRITGPRNRFALVDADHYVFIAGGVGITPILPMVREVAAREDSPTWSLLYGGRSLATMAYQDEIQEMSRGRATLIPEDRLGLPDLDEALQGLPAGAAVYCCGPEGLLRAVEDRCDRWLPEGALHLERFGAAEESPAAGEEAGDTETFVVELRRTGCSLTVPPDRSVLSVVREAVPGIPSSCEEGYCGTCETTVLEGTPLHRDTLLTDEEREAGDTMMICVGRSRSGKLVLDL
ncbi:PDR/VanB family oxidoreductase [Streptomyces sp. TRM49041]|uniref:PDR/VanB family oxidoreductase n=1 Tax=Streptomyces sp. TRM49041 TaxID=2603216 RepID=UPI0011ED029B|nr:PDR/VanB family oxidoreductase [Streptomyces sp. TRM49041]